MPLDKNLLKKIKKIKAVNSEDFSVTLVFSDEKIKTISLKRFFNPPEGLALKIVRGDMFENCFVETGSLAWPNGLEFSADSIYILEESVKNQGVA